MSYDPFSGGEEEGLEVRRPVRGRRMGEVRAVGLRSRPMSGLPPCI